MNKRNEFSKEIENRKLSDDILAALALLHYQKPTRIQQQVIPAMLSGQNVFAKAPTGSGKTAAFGIPLCEQVVWEERRPQVLVLEPTRELTDQVREELFYIGRLKRLQVAAVFGGFPIDKQMQTLKQRVHIVVGTPGRLMDHIRRGSLHLEKISRVVIDEADLMLDMGFAEAVREILAMLPECAGVSLFSATLKSEVYKMVNDEVNDAVIIADETPEGEKPMIRQTFYRAEKEDKYPLFLQVLKQENPGSAMIFCNTREMVNVLLQKMRRDRIFCGMIHGEMPQRERLKTVNAFRRGGFRFLIATDVAARGIDVPEVTHIINYDFPGGLETYVHRIGRTARNGKSGTAVSLVNESEERLLTLLREEYQTDVSFAELSDLTQADEQQFWQAQRQKAALKPQKGSGFAGQITKLAIAGGRKSKIRSGDIVATICSIEGVEAADIGVIDIRDSLSLVEILNQKGETVLTGLQGRTLKGKVRKVKRY